MPELPTPMKAVTGTMPAGEDGSWAFEVKWDGMRVIAAVDSTAPRGIRAVSSNGIDVGDRFPELDGLAEHLAGHEVILDGEMVAFAGIRSDFGLLQQRIHIASRPEAERRARSVPACFVLFDLLGLDGVATVGLPYLDRRRLLADLVDDGPHWQVPAHHIGGGPELFEAAAAQGLEGLIAKRVESVYVPGRRSPDWRKLKIRRSQELVVGGWSRGAGGRGASFGALLLGYHGPGGLEFAGAVGTGFEDVEIRRLRNELDRLATVDSPFAVPLPPSAARNANWVTPELVVAVEFAEWTAEGRLRHPAYIGQRLDRDPGTVIREPML